MGSAPPTQPVFAPGRILYTSMQSVADGVNWAVGTPRGGQPRRPQFHLQQTVAQSLANGANTGILFDVEVADTDAGHSTTVNTSRYTSPTAGTFWVTGTILYSANATGARGAVFRMNGSSAQFSFWEDVQAVATGDATGVSTSGLVTFNGTTDYLELVCYQTSTAALNTSTAIGGCRLAGFMISV